MNTINGISYPDKLEIQRAKKVIERGIDFQDKLDKANEKMNHNINAEVMKYDW